MIADKNLENQKYKSKYIKMFKSFGAKLKNLTDGGEGTTGYKHTKEAILKISEANRNRKKVDKPKKEKSKGKHSN